MYKPALTATAKQILFVLAAEQIMRQADTQIFPLDGDDFLISGWAGLGMTGRGGASNPPPFSLHLNLNSLSVFAIRATSCTAQVSCENKILFSVTLCVDRLCISLIYCND